MSREEVAAAMRNLQLSLDGLQRELEGATAQTHMRVPHRHCMQLLRQALAYLKQGCPAASIRGAGRGLHLHDRQTVELPIPPPPPPPRLPGNQAIPQLTATPLALGCHPRAVQHYMGAAHAAKVLAPDRPSCSPAPAGAIRALPDTKREALPEALAAVRTRLARFGLEQIAELDSFASEAGWRVRKGAATKWHNRFGGETRTRLAVGVAGGECCRNRRYSGRRSTRAFARCLPAPPTQALTHAR